MESDNDDDQHMLSHSISTSNLESAAVEAAIADGILKGTNKLMNDPNRLKKSGIRRGKWTAEEEAYSNQLIQEFKAGLLPLTDGTTLRTFLSKLLNCDPMRISKKFVGGNCIGKQVFRRRQADIDKLTQDQIEENRKLLAELERRFLERVAQTNRVKVPGVSLSENMISGPSPSSNSAVVNPRQMVSLNSDMQIMTDHHQGGGGGNMMTNSINNNHRNNNMNNTSATVIMDTVVDTNPIKTRAKREPKPSAAQIRSGEYQKPGLRYVAPAEHQPIQLPYGYIAPNSNTGYYPPPPPPLPLPSQNKIQPSFASNAQLLYENGMMMSFSSVDDLGAFLDPNVSLSSIDILSTLDTDQSVPTSSSSTSQYYPRQNTSVPSTSSSSSSNNAQLMPEHAPEPTIFPWNAPKNVAASATAAANHSYGSYGGMGFRTESLDVLFPQNNNGSSSSSSSGGQPSRPPPGYPPQPSNANANRVPANSTITGGATGERGQNHDQASLYQPKTISSSSSSSQPPPQQQQYFQSQPPQSQYHQQQQQPQYHQSQQQPQYSAQQNQMPRNSSIENFWMLVDMGDLPEPDNGVLSENLFGNTQPPQQAQVQYPLQSIQSHIPHHGHHQQQQPLHNYPHQGQAYQGQAHQAHPQHQQGLQGKDPVPVPGVQSKLSGPASSQVSSSSSSGLGQSPLTDKLYAPYPPAIVSSTGPASITGQGGSCQQGVAISNVKEESLVPPQQPAASTNYHSKGVLSSVDASSHLYGSKGWPTSNTSEMQAVVGSTHMIPTPATSSTIRAHNNIMEDTALKLGISQPPTIKTEVLAGYKHALSHVQGGGSLLQNINGKKEASNTSIVTGLPNNKYTSTTVSLPTSNTTGTKSASQYGYHPFTQEDMKTISQDAIGKTEEEKRNSIKRKFEDTPK